MTDNFEFLEEITNVEMINDEIVIEASEGTTGIQNLTEVKDVDFSKMEYSKAHTLNQDEDGKLSFEPLTIPEIPDPTWNSLPDKPDTFPPSSHKHPISDIDNFPEIPVLPSVIGDMKKEDYDTDGDGKVDEANYATTSGSSTYATEAGTATPKSHSHVKTDISNFPETMPPSSHSHVKTDISNFPETMPPSSHSHVKTDISNFPETMPPSSHSHVKTDISNFPTEMTPSAHTHVKNDISNFPTEMTPSAHTHTKSNITDFTHGHVKEDISNFPTEMTPSAHTHTKSNITDFTHTHTISNITDMPSIPAAEGNWNAWAKPASPSAYDDEFDDGSFDTTKWEKQYGGSVGDLIITESGTNMFIENTNGTKWVGIACPIPEDCVNPYYIDISWTKMGANAISLPTAFGCGIQNENTSSWLGIMILMGAWSTSKGSITYQSVTNYASSGTSPNYCWDYSHPVSHGIFRIWFQKSGSYLNIKQGISFDGKGFLETYSANSMVSFVSGKMKLKFLLLGSGTAGSTPIAIDFIRFKQQNTFSWKDPCWGRMV